jgi:hypothetical protein
VHAQQTVGAANTLGALPLLLAVRALQKGEVGALGADQHTAPYVVRLLLDCSYTGVVLLSHYCYTAATLFRRVCVAIIEV